jgi:hypothetical protein
MLTEGTTDASDHFETASVATKDADFTEALIERVQSKTYYQVRDLKIDHRGAHVVVTGTSRTYYVKQLVTQAILSTVPSVKLDNEIRVYASC